MSIGSTRVKLYFRCEKLADKDTFSKSDPFLVLSAVPTAVGTYSTSSIGSRYQQQHRSNPHRPVELGRTETVMNNLNPKFDKSFEVDYFFEQKQEFHVQLWDDDDGKTVEENDSLGTCKFQLAHVVGSRNATLAVDIKPQGKLFVSAFEVSQSTRDTVTIQFAGRSLKKMDFFGKSDPYFKFYRVQPNGTKHLLHHSKVIDNTLDPNWLPCPIFKLNDLTGKDLSERTLLFECYDEDLISDDSMGEFRCSLQEILDAHRDKTSFKLFDAKKKPYGDIIVSNAAFNHAPTFLEFLRGGLQVNLAVSIDFTGSNGIPTSPKSLHFMSPHEPNQYVRAIMSVGDILMQYDTDKQVPAFGFGAQLPDGQVSHCFHLNFQPNPYVEGVQGVLDNYGRALSSVRLAGPTNFAPTIRNALHLAKSSADTYTILLILTDGEITDMDKTVDAIVSADDAPLSIVIVGVGNGCDFQMMDQLDADKEPLRGRDGRPSRRDSVQFVPFRDFQHAPPGALAAEVLREIPDQVVDWAMITHRKPPPQPQQPLTSAGYPAPNLDSSSMAPPSGYPAAPPPPPQ